MPATLSLPDLDALHPAALKAMILAQQDHYKAQHETYTATLSSRVTEIDRLKLLVDKLQRMLFGAKSEKVLRQIEQLELQLEELGAAELSRRSGCLLQSNGPLPPSLFAVLYRSIFGARFTLMCPITPPAPTAAKVQERNFARKGGVQILSRAVHLLRTG